MLSDIYYYEGILWMGFVGGDRKERLRMQRSKVGCFLKLFFNIWMRRNQKLFMYVLSKNFLCEKEKKQFFSYNKF